MVTKTKKKSTESSAKSKTVKAKAPAAKSAKKQSSAEKKAKKSKVVQRKAASKTQVRLAKPKKKTATKAASGEGSRWKEKPVGHAPHSARISPVKGDILPLASRTTFEPKYSKDRKWLVVDAAGQTVGRLASEIAMLLRGKHKPSFTPNNDAGDFIVVINAEKVHFTSNKEEDKNYFQHSGWIGGMKVTTPAKLRETHPERILRHAVKGMVPRSPLGRDQMRKLKIYAGETHPHQAQNPVVWKLRYSAKQS
jgi:large subunit ribosomal protein L13